jgi:pimeloyl-ACP methyl ester carboxylesterase
MPFFERDHLKLYYEEHGDGFPVLLIAPGGMRSSVPFWSNTPWNPIEHLSPHYRVIAMDQRNAGQSVGPISASDSWHTFTDDQLALLDHLGVDKFHVAGMCIGGPYIMGLIKAAPERVTAAIVFQTIGLDNDRQLFHDMFDGWASELKAARPDVSEATWVSFRNAMYSGDFLFNADRDFVRNCQTPMVVLMGNDAYHPEVSSRELAELAPNAVFIEKWKEPEHQAAAKQIIEQVLAENTPR